MTSIIFYIALVILMISIVLSFWKWRRTGNWIPYLFVGVFITIFLMVLPIQWIDEGEAYWSPTLYIIISSLKYSIESLGGGQAIEQLEKISLIGWEKTLYMVIGYLIAIITPFLTSSLVLSFIGDYFERICYFFTFSRKCYVFSEVNYNTIAIAKGIKKTPGRKVFVFCNSKNIDKGLLKQARQLHALLLYAPCSAVKLYPSFKIKEYEFNLLSNQEDENIELAEAILFQKKQLKNRKVTINAFIHSKTNISILESLVVEIKNESEEYNFIKLRFIDEISLFCNNLLYTHPLFENIKGKNTVSALIIGYGDLGKEMLKTILWNGQIDGFNLKIRVIDKNADLAQQFTFAECPELCNYDIEFIKVDVLMPAFEKIVKQYIDSTFVCVSTGSDTLNIDTAEKVYQIFHRHDTEITTPIYTRVRSEAKVKNLNRYGKYLKERHIHIFGTIESIYSECTLFSSELEKLAFAVHLCYNGLLDDDSSSYQEVRYSFETSFYNRRSSMASALHIPTKLYQCGFKAFSSLNDISEEELQQIEKNLSDPSIVTALARNEHDRWNAFMCCEGYRTANIETMLNYAPILKNHQDKKGYLHPCIVPWEQLDNVQREYNKLEIAIKDFKSYDYKIVASIPQIIRKAKKL